MYKLNVIIIVALVLFAIFHYTTVNNRTATIDSLENEMSLYKAKVDSINTVNKSISDSISSLKDSMLVYKASIRLYNDSLVGIKQYYENKTVTVNSLSDSASYIFFKRYITNHSDRFGISTN